MRKVPFSSLPSFRLRLNEKVSLEKIRFLCMDHDGGSVFVSPVDKEILQAQKKVGENGGWLLLEHIA